MTTKLHLTKCLFQPTLEVFTIILSVILSTTSTQTQLIALGVFFYALMRYNAIQSLAMFDVTRRHTDTQLSTLASALHTAFSKDTTDFSHTLHANASSTTIEIAVSLFFYAALAASALLFLISQITF